ncbi:hypothetical protein M406DRAFT_247049 [Cryphonectria parasitica EP155]|uniref:Zn(2)-C6 fungal-type domain-containing protein n=1 Tax=Cryphonectria parasitica (strain ATCC 38755 / EP155) TaxID=660469 RepID=A0A9P4YCD2_CRYP1|nr:uncharacterized protein M406DRAFT_247049 [Cryphonectria parasitica EP155]KAF3770470.1 hypothetical protein M406DRAFT_247049 [Cryphonectria parasitica EP155]
MVGVPGKYKGCNTCRARRVKCDNQRPLCKKCIDSGRECQGYERETIFIVGTVEDKGRCSSHPPRNSKSQSDTASSSRQASPVPESSSRLSPVKPLRSAWDDVVPLSKSGKTYQLRIAALYMPALAYGRTNSAGSRTTLLTLPAYTPVDIQPRYGNEEFQLQAHCLASMASASDSMLLYLFDYNSSLAYTGVSAWEGPLDQEDKIRQMGPGSFTSFPAHHFFVRVYRPAAIVTGLINRKPVFCGEAEWIATPWERHPKAPFDHLLDILSSIPALLQQLDHLLSLDATTARRFMAQDLLDSALGIQAALEHWHASLHHSSRGGGGHHHHHHHHHHRHQAAAHVPFGEPISFRDALAALTFTYYWTAQVLFYPCIGLLGHTISAPVVDEDLRQQAGYGPPRPNNNVDPEAYGTDQLRTVAAHVCRGLDAALAATAQPDLLAFPVRVAETFYGGISVVTQSEDGAMELMWLAAFKDRIVGRGQDLARSVMSKGWKDLADW